jgi:hypothetical protein
MARGWFGDQAGHRRAGRLGGLARRKNRKQDGDEEQSGSEGQGTQ